MSAEILSPGYGSAAGVLVGRDGTGPGQHPHHQGPRHQPPRPSPRRLPQSPPQCLSSADLAPGVVLEQDQVRGNTAIRGGAQNHDNVNVFIDGVSQKNNVLRGGVVGQDSSRGNPFPQSAVKEFKIITQNYKAEFDQVSSAAITAVTKSGGNEIHGDAYFDRTETDE